MKTLLVVITLLLPAGLAISCARLNLFERYKAGTLELWIGGQIQVEQECRRRDAVSLASDVRILGCTDFATATIISILDARVIAHEYCHFTKKTMSHEICPLR